MNIVENSKKYAFECHSRMNQLYDGKPYSFHLESVVDIAKRFIYYIPLNKLDIVLSGCYLHDVIEDCKEIGVTWESVMKISNSEIATLSKVLATGDGTRKERFSDDYYNGIKNTELATFIKLCDRISNVKESVDNKGKMKMYRKEHQHFKEMLYVEGEYEDMWNFLDNLITQ